MFVMSSAPDPRCDGEDRVRPEAPAGSALRVIQGAGCLRVGIVPDTPGFSTWNANTGRLEGLEIEIAKAMSQAIFGGTRESATKKIEFIETTPAGREQVLRHDLADMIIATFSVHGSSRNRLDFSRPYFGTSLGVLTRADGRFERREDLAQGVIAVVDGTVDLAYAREHRLGDRLEVCERPREAVRAVFQGHADAAIGSVGVLESFAMELPSVLARAVYSLMPLAYSVAVPKGHDDVRNVVDAMIDDMFEDGSLVHVAQRHVAQRHRGFFRSGRRARVIH